MKYLISNRISIVAVFLISQNTFFSNLYSMNKPENETYTSNDESKKPTLRKRFLNATLNKVNFSHGPANYNTGSCYFRKEEKYLELSLTVEGNGEKYFYLKNQDGTDAFFTIENCKIIPINGSDMAYCKTYPEIVFAAEILLLFSKKYNNRDKTLFNQSDTIKLKEKSLKNYHDVTIRTLR